MLTALKSGEIFEHALCMNDPGVPVLSYLYLLPTSLFCQILPHSCGNNTSPADVFFLSPPQRVCRLSMKILQMLLLRQVATENDIFVESFAKMSPWCVIFLVKTTKQTYGPAYSSTCHITIFSIVTKTRAWKNEIRLRIKTMPLLTWRNFCISSEWENSTVM